MGHWTTRRHYCPLLCTLQGPSSSKGWEGFRWDRSELFPAKWCSTSNGRLSIRRYASTKSSWPRGESDGKEVFLVRVLVRLGRWGACQWMVLPSFFCIFFFSWQERITVLRLEFFQFIDLFIYFFLGDYQYIAIQRMLSAIFTAAPLLVSMSSVVSRPSTVKFPYYNPFTVQLNWASRSRQTDILEANEVDGRLPQVFKSKSLSPSDNGKVHQPHLISDLNIHRSSISKKKVFPLNIKRIFLRLQNLKEGGT